MTPLIHWTLREAHRLVYSHDTCVVQKFSSSSAPVLFPVTPWCVPSLFIAVHSHLHLSHAKYPAKPVENHGRDEVGKHTGRKLMETLIFQEVPELPISKPASWGCVCSEWGGPCCLFPIETPHYVLTSPLICCALHVLEMWAGEGLLYPRKVKSRKSSDLPCDGPWKSLCYVFSWWFYLYIESLQWMVWRQSSFKWLIFYR